MDLIILIFIGESFPVDSFSIGLVVEKWVTIAASRSGREASSTSCRAIDNPRRRRPIATQSTSRRPPTTKQIEQREACYRRLQLLYGRRCQPQQRSTTTQPLPNSADIYRATRQGNFCDM